MGSVVRVHGQWWVYGRTRVLGPFRSERAALRAMREEGEE